LIHVFHNKVIICGKRLKCGNPASTKEFNIKIHWYCGQKSSTIKKSIPRPGATFHMSAEQVTHKGANKTIKQKVDH